MATVTLTTEGGMNNFKVRNHIPRHELLNGELTFDMQTHIKRDRDLVLHELFPPSVNTGFVKGEASRLLRTNLSRPTFGKNVLKSFKIPFEIRGNLDEGFEKRFSEVHSAGEKYT